MIILVDLMLIKIEFIKIEGREVLSIIYPNEHTKLFLFFIVFKKILMMKNIIQIKTIQNVCLRALITYDS